MPKSELLKITENWLPFTDEETVDVVHKCLQNVHQLALQLVLEYILRLLNWFVYLFKKLIKNRGQSNTVIIAKTSKTV